MTTVAICQARMGSTRLPGKVLKDISDRTTIEWVVTAARQAPGVDKVVVATSTLPADDAIVALCESEGIDVFRGSETDVLSRLLGAAHHYKADVVVRLTCDCPFLDSQVIGEVIELRKRKNVAYATNTDPPTYPDGLDVEVCTLSALEAAAREAVRGSDRDTVTRFLVRNRHRFPAANLVCPLPGLVGERWVLDSPEDYEFVVEVASKLKRFPVHYLDILKILDENPEIRKLNSKYTRNERFYEGISKENSKSVGYTASVKLLEKAEKIIPLGAQTFSKSKLMFPEGAAPLFVTHGDGGYVFDVDGNDYVDLVGGLLPNILGYRDPDVDDAIRDQLSRGISFSLATPLEEELAHLLGQHIPSAEMVRFGKNGSDVTTAAVRLARHVTGRDKVMVGGYHGWHDWTTANSAGVPAAISDLSLKGIYCDDDTGHNEIAAIIIEPEFLSHANLADLRKHCDHYGSVLIFDEIITGFRCGIGGLQGVTGITPDLSTFGKAMANGMPLSALVGLEKYMSRIPEIAFSGTFFGETLSLAAGIATINKLVRLDVPRYLNTMGGMLRAEINILMAKHGVTGISLHGELELNRIRFKEKNLQALFIQEMAKNGVLIIGSHNTCFAHKKPELDRILSAWDATLLAISQGVALKGKIRGNNVRAGQINTDYRR